MSLRIQEKTVQEVLARYYSGLGYVVKRERKTPVGIIDLILYRNMGLSEYEKVLIEVKEHGSIKHAIGQILSYREYHKDCTRLEIVYFTRDGKYKGIDRIYQDNREIDFKYIGNLVEIGELIECQEKIKVQESSKVLRRSSATTLLNTDSIQEELLEFQLDLGISIGVSLDSITF